MEENKTYEVLAYRHVNTGAVVKKGSPDFWQGEIGTEGIWEIYSVKRLGDDEIFTIGDRLTHWETESDTIMAIGYRSGTTNLWLYTDVQNEYGTVLTGVQKCERKSDYPGTETVLQEAQRLIYGDRQQSYGSVTDNFGKIAQIWSAILGVEVCAKDVGMCMIAVKLARETYKPSRDNIADIAGYAGCLEKLEKGE